MTLISREKGHGNIILIGMPGSQKHGGALCLPKDWQELCGY